MALSISSEAVRLIEARGATPTAARVQILGMLLTAESALSHHALMAQASAAGRPLDKVTLYRVLDWLVEQTLAHSVTGQDRVRRFSVSHAHAGHSSHAHFECDECGRLFCLPEPATPPATPSGFETRRVDLTLHGRCADCTHTH
jgi:Fur family ferric uptake transcriptional regulator